MIRAVDSDNDWLFGKGKQDYLRDEEELVQDLDTRLQEWVGDCFFQLNAGVDYRNYLDRGTKFLLDSDIKKVILTTNGVIRINSFESVIDTDLREYSATINIFTIYGDLDYKFIQGGTNA